MKRENREEEEEKETDKEMLTRKVEKYKGEILQGEMRSWEKGRERDRGRGGGRKQTWKQSGIWRERTKRAGNWKGADGNVREGK